MSEGPQVIQTRNLVRFQIQIMQQAIAYLEGTSHLAAAKALVDHFVRPVPADDTRCCNWADLCGPCPQWKPDTSGGYCRNCGHHKTCHAAFRPSPEELKRAAHEAEKKG